MRVIIAVLMMILASFSVAAYSLESITDSGNVPRISDELAAFITFEDAIDVDLNNDGDMSDYVVQYYDLGTKETKSSGLEAVDFDLFGYRLVAEDKSGMIWIYNTKTKEALKTAARGSQLSFNGKNIAFISHEQFTGDLNGDNDEDDTIIQYYDVNTEEIINTRTEGTNPVVLEKYIVFETKENYAEKDFNDDGDLDDTIIRAYDLEAEKILNTKTEGKNSIGFDEPIVVIEHENNFWKLDLGKSKKTNLKIIGDNPSMHEDLLVYEKNKELFVYNLATTAEKSLELYGTEPKIFSESIIFVDEENKIVVLKGEDPDDDSIPDFADNCLEINNPNQNDDDKDGIGNGCDEQQVTAQAVAETQEQTKKTQKELSTTKDTSGQPEFTTQSAPELLQTVQVTPTAPILEPELTTQTSQERTPLPAVPVKEKNNNNPMYWFLVAVAIAIVGALTFIIPRLLKKRKGFGF